MADRTVILHYHLFKNAGTSLDRILKKNFPGRWVTREFPRKGGRNTHLVEDWIRSEPDAIAFSSHTMMGPLPAIDGVRIISLLFLRDPVERVVSAYRFERKQDADTLGTRLAREHDLAGYVRSRLALEGDRQCRNFQTYQLAAFVPGFEPEIDRACRALGLLTFIGIVEDFSGSIARLEALLRTDFPDFSGEVVLANASDKSDPPPDAETLALLEESNRLDRRLIHHFLAAQACG